MNEPTPQPEAAPATAPLLPVLKVDVGRVLAIVAHPDDLEYGASAAVAAWTRAGHEVVYVLVTSGEAGIDGVAPAEAGPLREREQRASAGVVGVETVEFLAHADGTVHAGLALRRDLAAAIRRHRPDTLLLSNHRETWGPGMLNSADHRAVGQAALDAMSDAGNRWIFRDLIDDLGLEPHSARRALVAMSPQPTHAVDVTEAVDAAVASLVEHRAYLDGLGDHPMADPEIVRAWLHGAGALAGIDAALLVEVFGDAG